MLSCPLQTFTSFYYLTAISLENNSLLQGGSRASHNQISPLNAVCKSTQIRDPPQSLHHWQWFAPPSPQCSAWTPTGPLRCWSTNKCRIQTTETYCHPMIWFLTLSSLKQKLQHLSSKFWPQTEYRNFHLLILDLFKLCPSYFSFWKPREKPAEERDLLCLYFSKFKLLRLKTVLIHII